MSDDNTTDANAENADTTPTEAIDVTQPPAQEAQGTIAAEQQAPRDSNRTRTILEIVGGVAAAVLIVVAAVGGFAAGLVVGDDHDGRGGKDGRGGMSEYEARDGMGRGYDNDGMGRGYDNDGMGRGYDNDGMGRGYDNDGMGGEFAVPPMPPGPAPQS